MCATPATADDGGGPAFVPPIAGMPYVGSELTIGQVDQGASCGRQDVDPQLELEWLSNGIPLPEERQGNVLKLIPDDRGKRISFNVRALGAGCDSSYHSGETPPIAASNRAMGWTGRGNFELLGRTDSGDLVLYPRTYESSWQHLGPVERVLRFTGSWDEPRVVGTGWDNFDTVFSPGDFDGDGFNDVLGRDRAGGLQLYPGDGSGGWLPPRQVGWGWGNFDVVIGPGDFNGDGNNDVLARDRSGYLYLYPGDGVGGWLTPSAVGEGWQIFDTIVGAGDTTGDGTVDIFARDRSGVLYQYPANGHGGWGTPFVAGVGWNVMTEISAAGPFEKRGLNSFMAVQPAADIIGIDQNGDLRRYEGRPFGLIGGERIGAGWSIFNTLI